MQQTLQKAKKQTITNNNINYSNNNKTQLLFIEQTHNFSISYAFHRKFLDVFSSPLMTIGLEYPEISKRKHTAQEMFKTKDWRLKENKKGKLNDSLKRGKLTIALEQKPRKDEQNAFTLGLSVYPEQR